MDYEYAKDGDVGGIGTTGKVVLLSWAALSWAVHIKVVHATGNINSAA